MDNAVDLTANDIEVPTQVSTAMPIEGNKPLYAKGISKDVHKKLRLACAYLSLTQSEFLGSAIEHEIQRRNIPETLFVPQT